MTRASTSPKRSNSDSSESVPTLPTMYRRIGKRVIDALLGSVALVVLSPIMAVIVVAIRLDDRGPALFRQRRLGKDGSEFVFLKFRSMPVNTAIVESAAADTLQVTRVGQIIRRTSLDELPQLVNIVRGDMSVVGPRPSLPTQTELIDLRRENGSIALRPGLTGLAQINSFDSMSTQDKARWDGIYGRSVSFLTDTAIIARTVKYLAKPPPSY